MKTLLLLGAMALTGCASYKVEDLRALIVSGQCREAINLVSNVGGSPMFNNLGVIAQDCERDPKKARSYFEYAARQGDSLAVDNLIRNGWSVPSPEIKQQSNTSNAAGIDLGLQLLRAAQPQAQPMRTITCDTDRFGNGLQTTCR